MHRKRSLSVVLGVSCLAVLALLLTVVGPASGQVKAHQTAKVTIVSVTVGKPSELAYKLSKFSALPAGTFTFNVKNAGLGIHNFKICTTSAATAAKNACVGKATPSLKPGQSAKLTVILTKKGKYEFLCSVPGHAAAGMKGLLGVGVKVTPLASTTPPPNPNPSPAPAPPPPAPGGGGGASASECPPGQTIAANGGKDDDADDQGGPTDNDGCL